MTISVHLFISRTLRSSHFSGPGRSAECSVNLETKAGEYELLLLIPYGHLPYCGSHSCLNQKVTLTTQHFFPLIESLRVRDPGLALADVEVSIDSRNFSTG